MLKFNIFRIPVTVHPMFWVITLIFSLWIVGESATPSLIIMAVLAFFLSILIHELGHGLMARYYGAPVRIDLYGLGGQAGYILPNPTKKKTITITVAGPALQLIVGVISSLLLQPLAMGSMAAPFIYFFSAISILFALFNLIPVYPMDGGQILYEALPYNKKHITFRVGLVICLFGVLFGLVTGRLLLVVFASLGAWGCYQRLKQF